MEDECLAGIAKKWQKRFDKVMKMNPETKLSFFDKTPNAIKVLSYLSDPRVCIVHEIYQHPKLKKELKEQGDRKWYEHKYGKDGYRKIEIRRCEICHRFGYAKTLTNVGNYYDVTNVGAIQTRIKALCKKVPAFKQHLREAHGLEV